MTSEVMTVGKRWKPIVVGCCWDVFGICWPSEVTNMLGNGRCNPYFNGYITGMGPSTSEAPENC